MPRIPQCSCRAFVHTKGKDNAEIRGGERRIWEGRINAEVRRDVEEEGSKDGKEVFID
jgi:hypothetical protein